MTQASPPTPWRALVVLAALGDDRRRWQVARQTVERHFDDERHFDCMLLAYSARAVASNGTHERFLRRDRGTYGAFIKAGAGQLPQGKTALPGLLCAGDSTFPGIGMPAVAASGLLAANSCVSVQEHWRMLDQIRL